jgi:hypothetical protein
VAYVLVVAAGITAALAVAAILIIAAAGGCPFLYVDYGQGYELAGVPYAGATHPASARDDLIPLRALPVGKVSMRQINGGQQEIEHTDRISLLLVDHPKGTRALPTADQKVVVVGPSIPPRAARDRSGADVLSLVESEDHRLVETDLERVSRESAPPGRDELTLDFKVPPGQGTPVLEVTASTSPWLDLVSANYLTLFGDHLEELKRRYHPRPEGRSIDLWVELYDGAHWRRLAAITPPGLERRVALPLPDAIGSDVRLRLSWGIGFWQINAAALSRQVAGAPAVRQLSPTRATGPDGADLRALLAETDGREHVAPRLGEAIELQFDVPAAPAGSARTSFYSSRGYYDLFPLPGPTHFSPAELSAIANDPDGFPRYGLELYRRYQALAARK